MPRANAQIDVGMYGSPLHLLTNYSINNDNDNNNNNNNSTVILKQGALNGPVKNTGKKSTNKSNYNNSCIFFLSYKIDWSTSRVKEAIHIRLHPDNINRVVAGIEIPKAWMPTIKQHNTHSVPMRTTKGTFSSLKDKDRNPPIKKQLKRGSKCTNHRQPRGYLHVI